VVRLGLRPSNVIDAIAEAFGNLGAEHLRDHYS
jgi:hypothetical protein